MSWYLHKYRREGPKKKEMLYSQIYRNETLHERIHKIPGNEYRYPVTLYINSGSEWYLFHSRPLPAEGCHVLVLVSLFPSKRHSLSALPPQDGNEESPIKVSSLTAIKTLLPMVKVPFARRRRRGLTACWRERLPFTRRKPTLCISMRLSAR